MCGQSYSMKRHSCNSVRFIAELPVFFTPRGNLIYLPCYILHNELNNVVIMVERNDVIQSMMELRPGMSHDEAELILNSSNVPMLLEDKLVRAHADSQDLAESALYGL